MAILNQRAFIRGVEAEIRIEDVTLECNNLLFEIGIGRFRSVEQLRKSPCKHHLRFLHLQDCLIIPSLDQWHCDLALDGQVDKYVQYLNVDLPDTSGSDKPRSYLDTIEQVSLQAVCR